MKYFKNEQSIFAAYGAPYVGLVMVNYHTIKGK